MVQGKETTLKLFIETPGGKQAQKPMTMSESGGVSRKYPASAPPMHKR